MLNLSPLFYSTTEESSLLSNIELDPVRKESLAHSKREIRTWLRENLPARLKTDEAVREEVRPRFFTQGSWAYGTLNAPAKVTQQADVDDGTYLPMSFMKEVSRPSIASRIFFAAVEETLQPLILARGWKLDRTKPTCVRVELAPDAHEDIPLYAIPDVEFAKLTAALTSHGHRSLTEAVSFAEHDAWTALPTESVLLAHRDDNWVRSDPRPIKDWFFKAVEVHGKQLRRVIRYVKAHRDWQWNKGGPASILLMAATVECFEVRHRRDDLALLDVVRRLPAILRRGVANPTDSDESLTDRLGQKGVEDACAKLEQLTLYLNASLDAADPAQACIWMQQLFGERFPNEPQRVKRVSVAETIGAAPIAAVASPLVGRSKAG